MCDSCVDSVGLAERTTGNWGSQLIAQGPQLARRAMMYGGVVAITSTAVISTLGLWWMNMGSVYDLGTEGGRAKVGCVCYSAGGCVHVHSNESSNCEVELQLRVAPRLASINARWW